MDFKEIVTNEIKRQEQRIEKLERELETARTYLRAQRDMLKLLPEDGSAGNADEDASLRPSGDPAKVRDILRQHGAPLHVMELLSRLGKLQTSENRATLTGTLGNYVRKNRVFVKTAPNTFGLIGMVPNGSEKEDEVPESFGTPEADTPAPAMPTAVTPSRQSATPQPANSPALDEDIPF